LGGGGLDLLAGDRPHGDGRLLRGADRADAGSEGCDDREAQEKADAVCKQAKVAKAD